MLEVLSGHLFKPIFGWLHQLSYFEFWSYLDCTKDVKGVPRENKYNSKHRVGSNCANIAGGFVVDRASFCTRA